MASERVVEGKGLYAWLDRRFPITPLFKNHLAEYYTPKKLQFLVFFRKFSYRCIGSTNFDGYFFGNAL